MSKKAFFKKLKRSCCGALSLLTVLGVSAGCVKDPTQQTEFKKYELWGAPITEKVLQNVHQYESMKATAEIEIDTARNEHESAQVILTGGSEDSEYTVEVSDLKQVGGDEVYPAKNITVYNMKYTNVLAPWSSDALVGWYPDCLLPMEAAVKAGENKVKAGENQSIYFSFDTPDDQPVGTYEGTATVTVDGEKNVLPVSLRVRNVTVSEAPHHESMFINSWQFYLGEYDSTQEMFEKYIKMLYEYRLAPTALVFETTWGEEDARYFAEKAYELGSAENCSNIAIPTSKSASGIKDKQFRNYLVALAEKSMEKNFDLLAKCCVYGVDEPLSNNAFDKTKAFAQTFNEQRNAAVDILRGNKDEYLETYDIDEEFFETMIESIFDIHFITTTRYAANYDPYIDVYCPTFKDVEIGLTTGIYDDEEELWWYGAVSPKKPYPTYHIDDVLVSSRMVGWLQAIYGIKGNIYWGVDIYGDYRGGGSGWNYADDFYGDPARYINVNGDGFLVYPGKKYDVDGPLPSIRLESIRDGYEEYELLYDIIQKYKAVSEGIGKEFSAISTISDMASSLYTGTQITATNESFKEARKQILNLSEFTQSGVCFTDYKDDGEGTIEYKLYIPDGVAVTVSGVKAMDEETATGGKIVRYVADMTDPNAARVATFKTTVNGEEVSVERFLSGTVSRFGAEALAGAFTEGTVQGETALVNASDILAGEEGKFLKISLPDALKDKKQEIKFTDKDVISKLDGSVAKAVFNFYYDGEETELPIEVFVKYKNKVYEENITSSAFVFKKGYNQIEWKNLGNVNWEKNGELQYVIFSIGGYGDTARSDLYLKNVVIYNAREGS